MSLQLRCPAKVNLLLNILHKREDGFHELETIFQPVPIFDDLFLEHAGPGIALTCSDPALPIDGTNLVARAAVSFFKATAISPAVRIHLIKRIPMAAGMGGGSSNAAITLIGLNRLFDNPLSFEQLGSLGAGLGSDVVFFLGNSPALATGRGEKVQPLEPFKALEGSWMFLFHPGFGISTPWAYKQLASFPEVLEGRVGRAGELLRLLQARDFDLSRIGSKLFNSLEAPAFFKYPILVVYQEFLRSRGAWGALMSGSGSTTFALFETGEACRAAGAEFRSEFGNGGWLEMVRLDAIESCNRVS